MAYAGFIFYLSSQTWEGAPRFPYADKVFHIILYLMLAGLLIWALRATRFRYNKFIAVIAFSVALVYGLSDEIHQIFVSGREFSLLDLAADGVGAGIGTLIALRLAMFIRKEKIKVPD